MFSIQFTQKYVLTTAFTIGAAFSLYGCNSSSTSQVTTNTGIFIDAPVKGLQFSTPSQSGITNNKGEFKYLAGEKVTFNIDGLEIGSVNGKAEIPVTLLPKYLDIARLLQSLDIDPLEDLIDISGIKIPNDLKTQLNNLIQNNQGTFDSIMTQSQLESIESTSLVQLVNLSPVSEPAAIQHIIASLSKNLTDDADFSRQTFININNKTITSFFEDNSAIIYENNQGSFSTTDFAWLVANNKLNFIALTGDISESSLLSVDGNKHVFSTIGENETSDQTEISTQYKAKPISISDLDGKIISLDMSANNDCSSQTFKFSGDSVNVVLVCTLFPDGFLEFPRAVSTIDALDNAIQLSDDLFVDKLFLVEGSVDTEGKVAIFGKRGDTIIEVNIVNFSVVDKEASL